MKITFLGAVEEVTGSKYLIEQENSKVLVDCGLFQGDEEFSKRNWDALPIDPSSIDAVILTHAHIDHSGYIPALVKNGFKGKIYCSKPTFMLCSILLVDSGSLFEENAKRVQEENPHQYLEPLYTKRDAQYALQFFQIVDYNKTLNIGELKFTLVSSHHIPGSAFVIISDEKNTLTFSGDLGRPDQLIMKTPPHLKQTDFLVLESTYGDRLHEKEDPIKELGDIINKTVARGGTVIIPAFSVERTQTILYCLYQLKQKKAISNIPIYLDSPMAIDVTKLFCKFEDEHKISERLCKDIVDIATFTRTVEESKRLNHIINHPVIIIAGSGMADGGRVVHHLKRLISDAKNSVIFVGYQAEGTLGRALVDGRQEVEIFDKLYRVRAKIELIKSLSAHADYNEILDWLGNFESSIKKVFITHGEIQSALSLKKKIEERFGWPVVVPKYLESFDLD